jgi:hypothetical protein
MANTLTNLIPVIYRAVGVISRELAGFIPSVFIDASAEQAAKDQTITYPVVGSYTASDIAAAATGPDPNDTSVGNGTMSINKSRSVSFYWTGEEEFGLGSNYQNILRDQFAQAMRTLVNEVETDLAALYVHASRAYGTAGTTPFASDLSDPANMLKILLDNGAPVSDLNLVIDTAAGAKLRSLGQLTKVNEAGDNSLLRRGVLLDLHGFAIRESAKVKSHTKGTGASYQTNNGSGYAEGDITIALDTGSGTVLAGDVVTFTGDANKYVTKTALTGGNIVLANPGLRATLADNVAMSLAANYRANLAFARSAIHLLARVPKMPTGGDAADEVMTVTDPASGITFQIAVYRQRRRVAYEVGLAWGVKAAKPEHIAILLG